MRDPIYVGSDTFLYPKSTVIALFNQLYEEVKHGDDEHQKWLHDKIQDFIKENVL